MIPIGNIAKISTNVFFNNGDTSGKKIVVSIVQTGGQPCLQAGVLTTKTIIAIIKITRKYTTFHLFGFRNSLIPSILPV